jgi:hypothetical protein
MVWRRHRTIARTATLLAMLAGASLGVLTPALAAPDPAACVANPQSRALDFWLGDWTIGAPGGATSSVSLELGQCLVVERWGDGRGHSGENVFGYSADDKRWHGLFADNEGRVHVFFDGKVEPGLAVFTGPSLGPQGEAILNKVEIRRAGDGRVEQVWQKSTDGGKTWSVAFAGEYARKRS